MIPLVKLAVVSKNECEVPSFSEIPLVFLYLLYTPLEKQPYLVSISSYKLSVKSILLLICILF